MCDTSLDNTNQNNNYLGNFDNLETLLTTTSPNNIVADCNYVVNGNYVPENNLQYLDNSPRNTIFNNYDKYQQVSNPNYIQGNVYQEQIPNNYNSNYINGQYYSPYQNYQNNYQNNFQTDNAYLNPNAYYSQNNKPYTYRTGNIYYNAYNPGNYNYVNNFNNNKNKPSKVYNYKEHCVPGRYLDRIWRTWNNMDITVSNKGVPLKIEFGSDDKNTIQLYNTIKNNSNSHKQQERPSKEKYGKRILQSL